MAYIRTPKLPHSWLIFWVGGMACWCMHAERMLTSLALPLGVFGALYIVTPTHHHSQPTCMCRPQHHTACSRPRRHTPHSQPKDSWCRRPVVGRIVQHATCAKRVLPNSARCSVFAAAHVSCSFLCKCFYFILAEAPLPPSSLCGPCRVCSATITCVPLVRACPLHGESRC